MFYSLLFTFTVIVIFYIRRTNSYWKTKNVPGPKPWPLFGNILQSFTKKKTTGQIFREIYNKYEDCPLVGVYRTNDPILIIRDTEFVNRIFVKDSKSFFNNDFTVDKRLDPLQAASPFLQKDEEWKTTRTMLSPGFTSGKMKTLFHLIEQVNERLLTYLDLKPDIATGQTLETQNLCRRFTLDNVALSAFGIDGQSFENDESDFMKLATSFIAPGTFALSMLQTFPLASRLISLKVIPKKVEEALIQIVSDVLDHRNKSDIVANDFLQFISELGEKHQLNYAEITGHAATFFEDGYETSALVISYVLFNLSRHPEIQQRLRSEILHTEKTSVTGKITYEHLGTMSYLNACIYESMRLCPVLEHFTRVCKRPYTYKTANESPAHLKRMTVKIDVGTVCIIPFGGFCHDRHYFEDPKEYKPERFLNDNSSIKNVFHPFGGGHRICLGQRFGIMQVRMGVIQIIKNFQVSLSSQTKLPFEFLPWTILNKVKHGVWLIYKKIQY